MSIIACLWSSDRANHAGCEINKGDILAILNSKSSDFGGKSINLSDESKIFVNPL